MKSVKIMEPVSSLNTNSDGDPEENMISAPEITHALSNIENPEVSEIVKWKNFDHIAKYSFKIYKFPKPILKKLLIACNDELCEERNTLTILLPIIHKISTDYIMKYDNFCDEEMEQSAVKIMEILKKHSTQPIGSRYPTKLFKLCLKTLGSYPEKFLIKIATVYKQDILYIADKYLSDKVIEVHVNSTLTDLIMKLLKTMTPDQKREFVNDGLHIWFDKLIPLLMEQVAFGNPSLANCITLTEALAEELMHIDYSSHKSWKTLVTYIYGVDKYPALIKTALKNGSPHWYRIWNLFVRILKTQITLNRPNLGSPINSLLTVVEAAFKMNVEDRCRAFACWNVLIDNFSQETNESLVKKRIKLLMIPLNSNNSKVEETALAKFHTWWYLITKFNTRIEPYADTVLIPFIHFCFGKPMANSVLATPGMIYDSVKKLSVQAFSEIVGHRPQCGGCNNNFSPKLAGSLLNTQMLVSFLPDWMYALQSSIKLTVSDNGLNEAEQTVLCLWHSFIALLASMPDNNLRKDIVGQQFLVLYSLSIEKKTVSSNLPVILWKLMLHPVEDDYKTKSILKSSQNNFETSPTGIIFNLLRTPQYYSYYSRSFNYDPSSSIEILKPFTNLILDSTVNDPDVLVKYALNKLTNEEFDFVFWASIMESVLTSNYNFKMDTRVELLTWPIMNASPLNFVEHCQQIWESFYIASLRKFPEPSFYHTVFLALYKAYCNRLYSKVFIAYALLFILKNALEFGEKNFVVFEEEMRLITTILTNIGTKENLINAFDLFVEFLPTVVNEIIVCKSPFILFTKAVLSAINVSLKSIINSADIPLSKRELLINGILSSIGKLIELEQFQELNHTLFDILIICAKQISIWKPFNETAKAILVKCSNLDPSNMTLKQALEDLNSHAKLAKFATPQSTKKSEEPTVSKKIVNGEEFVVVKSNWKFNPRKLTDHQKEVLQRKRDDIPALYQDLSQSQDDCQLISWKAPNADSQTTTLSSSKSPSKEIDNFSLILNNYPTVEIVPKILDNLKTHVQDKQETVKSNRIVVDVIMKKDDHIPPTKIQKEQSPRLSLKDRIFQNMKSLAGHSTQRIENANNSNHVNKNIEVPETQYPETPKTQNEDKNMVNSAPTIRVTERPSRVKRKPKKFDTDFEEIPVLKRRRNSLMFMCVPDKHLNTEPSTEENRRIPDDNLSLNKQIIEDESSVIVTEIDPTELNYVNVNSTTDEYKEDNSCVLVTEKDTTTLTDKQTINDESKQENSCVIFTENDPVQLNDMQVISTNDEDKQGKIYVSEKKSVELNNTKAISRNDEDKSVNSNDANPKNIIDLDESDRISQSTHQKDCSDSHEFEQSVDKETSMVNSDNSIEHFELRTNKIPVTKSSKVRKSRLQNELVINMVEGHPYLSTTPQSEKRTRRKAVNKFSAKISNAGSKQTIDSQSKVKQERIPKVIKNNDRSKPDEDSTKGKESPVAEVNEQTDECNNMVQSEDFIESSQDSTVSVMSIKTPKRQVRKQAQNALVLIKSLKKTRKSKENKNVFVNEIMAKKKTEDNLQEDVIKMDVTANMDTQLINSSPLNTIEKDASDEDTTETKFTIMTESLEVATADTQLVDQTMCKQDDIENKTSQNSLDLVDEMSPKPIPVSSQECSPNNTISETAENVSRSSLSSPFKDDLERNKDFLNNTFDISPIKVSSPVDDRCKTPSPENSQDYVVITLTSPVQSNGEPIDRSGTPEKISPEKRDQSPLRETTDLSNNSPSSALSLKRNKPQVKSVGRAAQMLGCVLGTSSNMQAFKNSEKGNNIDESKQSPAKKSARRNLKSSYEDGGDSDMFLKFKRTLPAADSSPSCPILKRKHVHIVDETNISPASKRKRVSFHDPPVSTTMAVQKYIDPASQRSAIVRIIDIKSLNTPTNDTPRTPSLSDINESDATPDDMDTGSLEQTPQVDIVKTSDLNDTDSIYPNLINCSDPISNIALELSSPAMKSLLIEKLQGKVETVGDLANLTELEVNRLCIKAPKVVVVKKVLADYAKKIGMKTICGVYANDPKLATVDADIQTEAVLVTDVDVQTDDLAKVPTVTKSVLNTHVQTEEIKEKPLDQIIKASIDKPDFMEVLEKILDKDSKMKIAANLSMDNVTEVLEKKLLSDSRHILDLALKRQNPDDNDTNAAVEENQSLRILQEYLCDNFSPSDLVKFCSNLLNNVHSII